MRFMLGKFGGRIEDRNGPKEKETNIDTLMLVVCLSSVCRRQVYQFPLCLIANSERCARRLQFNTRADI